MLQLTCPRGYPTDAFWPTPGYLHPAASRPLRGCGIARLGLQLDSATAPAPPPIAYVDGSFGVPGRLRSCCCLRRARDQRPRVRPAHQAKACRLPHWLMPATASAGAHGHVRSPAHREMRCRVPRSGARACSPQAPAALGRGQGEPCAGCARPQAGQAHGGQSPGLPGPGRRWQTGFAVERG